MKAMTGKIGYLAVLAVVSLTWSSLAQGPLVPPGPPGPTMKTLSQIEPRTAITGLPYTIAAPGSYYLTTNLACSTWDGITIAACNVTVDFNGFSLANPNGTYSCVSGGPGANNVTIRNGAINGWGWGIDLENASCRIENILIYSNTFGFYASLQVGDRSLINGCGVFTNACSGIIAGKQSRVVDCWVIGNHGLGVSCQNESTVERCIIRDNTVGLYLSRSSVMNCVVAGSGGEGIVSDSGGNVIRNTLVHSNGYSGINIGDNSVVEGCSAVGNGLAYVGQGSGITVGDCSVLKDNVARANVYEGLKTGKGATVTHCSAMQNGWHGISVADCSTVAGCTVRGNSRDGILATYSAFIRDNACDLNTSNGIHVVNFNNRIDNNNLTGNFVGLLVETGGNVIIRNTARFTWGNGNYSIAGGNDTGPIGQAATATSPWANLSN